jgi:hypothetical protein
MSNRSLDVKLDEPEFYGAEEIFSDNPKPSQDRFKQRHNVDDDDDFTVKGRTQMRRPERGSERGQVKRKLAKKRSSVRTVSKRSYKPAKPVKTTKRRRTTKKRTRKPSKK